MNFYVIELRFFGNHRDIFVVEASEEKKAIMKAKHLLWDKHKTSYDVSVLSCVEYDDRVEAFKKRDSMILASIGPRPVKRKLALPNW